MDLETLKQELRRDEGLPGGKPALKPYVDTVGKMTIGYGRNLTDVGITTLEAEDMLEHDAVSALGELGFAFPWFAALDAVRQRALVNMCVNLGLPRLRGFHKMLAALQRGDYDTAAVELLDSRYARQVGARAVRLAQMIRKGNP